MRDPIACDLDEIEARLDDLQKRVALLRILTHDDPEPVDVTALTAGLICIGVVVVISIVWALV